VETLLFEKPVLTGLLGAISAVVLGFLWLQTARRQVLYALIGVLVLTAAGILAAWLVVTEREAVDGVLHEAAAAVEQNDVSALLNLIHSQAPGVRNQAQAEMPRYEFDAVSIKSNLQITLDNPKQPTQATARFNVLVDVSERNGLIKDRRVPRYCIVEFRKDGNAWRVYSYDHADPQQGLLKKR
jgi:hypothetical protein